MLSILTNIHFICYDSFNKGNIKGFCLIINKFSLVTFSNRRHCYGKYIIRRK
jgi:hypothetical protein